jgi:4-hydroxy-3-methylbut-2-en-1-yl diphosphate reductase
MHRDDAVASSAPAACLGADDRSDAGARPGLTVRLASPRGFCAGVDRAVRIVEEALRRYGAPIYVRHELVHNQTVVAALRGKGAVFVDDLDEVPADATVVFSAHGVPKAVPAAAERRNLIHFDATCPLVSKVHREAERHFANGCHILLIGHAGHPEVEGTFGQLPPGSMSLVQTAEQAALVAPPPGRLAFITQTTLSVDDTAAIVAVLRARFPGLEGPRREDICYATTNRQAAVKAIAPGADLVLVIGADNSSNSQRLREVALRAGARRALLIPTEAALPWSELAGVGTLGVTAGASAPESLVQALLARLATRFRLEIDERRLTDEDVVFKLPAALVEAVPAG